jgi:tRNA pseudouridine13 synthase
VAELDVSVFTAERQPAGLLWGGSPRWAEGEAGDAEQAYFAEFPEVTAMLERAGSRPARRVLRARVGQLQWHWQPAGLRLEFALGPGSYATMVLRELLDVRDCAGAGETEEQGESDD